eukprot:g12736.t1
MIGGEQDGTDGEQRGICARALRDVFREVSRRRQKGTATSVHMSFVELYNEHLFDLLLSPEMRSSRNQRPFNIFGGNGSERGVIGKRIASSLVSALKPTKEAPGRGVDSPPEQAPELAIYERPDGCTSHAILTVHLTTQTACWTSGDDPYKRRDQQTVEETQVRGGPRAGRGGRGEGVTSSKLNLVDLAGSEKSSVASSATAGDAAMLHREGRFINKSLAFLEQVTIALADRKREHIPFRCSKLTQFLKDSLGGNCRTLMIACVWPRPDLLQQSLATLKFATRMRCVKNDPVVNERPWSAEDELSSLRRQVRELKAQLALQNAHRAGHEGAGFAGATRESALGDGTTATHLFEELQEGWPGKGEEKEGRSKGGGGVGSRGPGGPFLPARQGDSSLGHGWAFAAAGNPRTGDEHVGGDHAGADVHDDATPSERTPGGGSAGTAEDEVCGSATRYLSSPSESLALGCEKNRFAAELMAEAHVVDEHKEDIAATGCESHGLGADFERFKNEEGVHINSHLQDVKAATKRCRSLVNDLAGRVNRAKSKIDSARAQLQRQEREEEEEDDEEGREVKSEGEDEGQEANVRRVLATQLKRRKRDYRRLFALLAEAKSDLRSLQQNKRQKEEN